MIKTIGIIFRMTKIFEYLIRNIKQYIKGSNVEIVCKNIWAKGEGK